MKRLIASVVALCAITSPVSRAQTGPKVETVAALPAPGPAKGETENITQGPDGSFYVTAILDKILWKISPQGKVDKFYTSATDAAFVSVAATSDEILLVAFKRPYKMAADYYNADVGNIVVVLDHTGKVKETIEAKDHKWFFNGITQAGPKAFLITDTAGNQILSLNLADKTITPWLHDDARLLHTNGIKIHQGFVYVTGAGKLWKVAIDGGKPKGMLQPVAEGVQIDDFSMTANGTMYFPSTKGLMRITPQGTVSTFVDSANAPDGAGIVTSLDGKYVYWATRNGPSKLLRVAVN